MAISKTHPNFCSICGKSVRLEKSKSDEYGNTAREKCYVPRTLQTPALSGWKEIANYMNKGVRTVQRYERELSLPVRRISRKGTGSVIATRADLDRWLSGSPPRAHSISALTPIAQRHNQLKADFLQIDSQVALTFSGIALGTSEPARKEHVTLTARKAYNAIMRLRQGVDLSLKEEDKLDANMARLKSELRSLGQNF